MPPGFNTDGVNRRTLLYPVQGAMLCQAVMVLLFLVPVQVTAQNFVYTIFEPVPLSGDMPAPEESIPGDTSLLENPEPADSEIAFPESTSSYALLLGVEESLVEEQELLQYEGIVDNEISLGGAYAPELAESLLSLGDAYRRNQEFEKALEAYDQAFQINRVHEGLFNSSQEAIVGAIAETYLAMGDLENAHSQEEYLFYLRQKIWHDDPGKLIQASIQYADWNYNLAEFAYHTNQSQSGEFLLKRVLDANTYYESAASSISSFNGSASPLLEPIAIQRARSNFYVARFLGILTNNMLSARGPSTTIGLSDDFTQSRYEIDLVSAGYKEGEDALLARLENVRQQENHEVAEEVVALLDLADWYLVFRRRNTADDNYSEALALLATLDSNEVHDLRQMLFSEEQPRQLPAFVPANYSREALQIPAHVELPKQAWVDVTFQVSRYGDASSIEVLGTSENLDPNLRRRLLRYISVSTFRPWYNNEGAPENHTFRIRYYISLIN